MESDSEEKRKKAAVKIENNVRNWPIIGCQAKRQYVKKLMKTRDYIVNSTRGWYIRMQIKTEKSTRGAVNTVECTRFRNFTSTSRIKLNGEQT